MKNLIHLLLNEVDKQFSNFVKELKKEKEITSIVNNWYYKNIFPTNSKKTFATIKELKQYLIDRKQLKESLRYQKTLHKLKTIEASKSFNKIIINVEYKKNRMWGYNPSAEAKVFYKDGTTDCFLSISISGWGYDKTSTAVASALNQVNGLLKLMYLKKDMVHNTKKSNRDLFGYGSGSGILPIIEGGVGISCYNKIMNKIGLKFYTLSSGKTFDVYIIDKK